MKPEGYAPVWIPLRTALACEMLSWGALGFPEEACGLIAGQDGQLTEFHPVTNVASFAFAAYTMAPDEELEIVMAIHQRGLAVTGIFHTHPSSIMPYPSGIDTGDAAWPELLYLIGSFGTDPPGLRAYRFTRKRKIIPIGIDLLP